MPSPKIQSKVGDLAASVCCQDDSTKSLYQRKLLRHSIHWRRMPLACYHAATGTDCCQSLPAVREDAAAAAVVAAAVVADAAVVAAAVVAAAAAAVVAVAAAVSLPSRMQWRAHHHEYHEEITLYIASPRH